jgi:hypothetical protein
LPPADSPSTVKGGGKAMVGSQAVVDHMHSGFCGKRHGAGQHLFG